MKTVTVMARVPGGGCTGLGIRHQVRHGHQVCEEYRLIRQGPGSDFLFQALKGRCPLRCGVQPPVYTLLYPAGQKRNGIVPVDIGILRLFGLAEEAEPEQAAKDTARNRSNAL